MNGGNFVVNWLQWKVNCGCGGDSSVEEDD